MKTVKCSFKNITEEEKNKFKNSSCLLTISVGQQTHENERFAATIDLINYSFKSCIIQIDDTLQRHTMALNHNEDPDYFYDVSKAEGKLWLERNEKYINRLKIPMKLYRWDEWLFRDNFDTQKNRLLNKLNEDLEYQKAFEVSIDNFISKCLQRNSRLMEFEIKRLKKLSFDFVLEECTALTLWPELICQYEAYPNGHNSAIEATKKLFIYPFYHDILRSITIIFKNAGQLTPQKFYLLDETIAEK